MAVSLLRCAHRALAGLALAPPLALAACASSGESTENVRFAVSATTATSAAAAAMAPTVRVGESRVLGRRVNLQEPVVMSAREGGNVAITFAHRQRTGTTLEMDARSLESRSAVAVAYPAHPRPAMPPFLSGEPTRVRLADGGSLACWTDDASSRVLVQIFGKDGSWRGSPVVVSPEGLDVFGTPHVATADGRHVVISFFSCDEDGFDLVATSVDAVH